MNKQEIFKEVVPDFHVYDGSKTRIEKYVKKAINLTFQEAKQKFLELIDESRGLFVTDGSWTFFKQKVEEETNNE